MSFEVKYNLVFQSQGQVLRLNMTPKSFEFILCSVMKLIKKILGLFSFKLSTIINKIGGKKISERDHSNNTRQSQCGGVGEQIENLLFQKILFKAFGSNILCLESISGSKIYFIFIF